jgi:hypothetical protein
MATLNFKFVANDAGLKSGVASAKGHLDDLDGKTSSVGASLGKAFAAMGAALLAAGLIRGLKDAALAAQEDEIAQRLLAEQLRITTGATDEQVDAAERFITKMSLMSGIADDDLRPALQNAVRATGDLTSGQKLVAIALDGAAASGKPLETVLQSLIKAQAGNSAALYKLAPELKAGKGTIDDYAASVKGMAEISANPFDKFKVSVGEAKEVIGAALLPSLNILIDTLSPLVQTLAPALAKVVAALAPIIAALAPVIVRVVTALLPLLPVLLQLIESLLPIITELLPPLVDLFIALIPVIIPVIETLASFLVPILKIVIDVLKNVIKWVGEVLDAFAPVGKAIMGAFSGIGAFFKGMINGWINLFEGFINGILDGINGIIDGINFLGKNSPIKFSIPRVGRVSIPNLAEGGIIPATPGGRLVNVAEAGKAEAVIPLDRLGELSGKGNTVNVYINQAVTAQTIIDTLNRYARSNGTSIASVLS